MTDSMSQAVADEVADDIWTLVDGIRAEAGVPLTRQDEVRILNIRRKLTRRLVAIVEIPAERRRGVQTALGRRSLSD